MRNLTSISPQRVGGHAGRWWAFTLLLGLLTLIGCSSDSPTAPQQTPGPAPPGPSAAWNVSVNANPNRLAAGSTVPSVVTFTVRRADNGQSPPDGTTLVVATTLGDLGSLGSGLQSLALSLFGGSAQALLFPGDIEGSALIRAQIESSTGQATITVAGPEVFFLSAVTPSFGDPAGGETVEITGGGIVAPVRVLMDGVVAQVTSVSSTRIRAITPAAQVAAGQTRRVNIVVTSDLGGLTEAADTLVGAFTYGGVPAPVPIQVFSVSPNSGPNEGGTQIVIAGQGFVAPVQVLFGQGSAQAFNGIEAIVESVTSTEVVVRSPSATGFGQDNRDQSVTVLVRNTQSGEGSTITSGFRYGVNILITSISPATGPPEGGQRVTVFGQGFDEPVAVSIGDFGGQPILSVTGTEVIFRTAAVQQLECTDITGAVSVTNIETGATAPGPLYTFEVDATKPIVTSVSPTAIPVAGGTPVTISGANFSEPLQLTIDGSLQSIISVSPGAIVFRSPLPTIAIEEEPCDDNADGKEGMRFIDTQVPFTILVRVLSSGCVNEPEATVGFVYQPADRSCRDDVGPVEPPPTANFDFALSGPTAVNFSDTSTGDPTSWAWDFGDGGSSTLQNPAHDYGPGAPGMTYTVELTVTNASGSSAAQKAVSFPVEPPPAAPTANFDFALSGPTAANFSDTSTGDPTSWAWDFGDGGSSTLQNPAHDYGPGAPGMTYTVELTVTNAGGSSTAQKSVSFPAAPPPPMGPTANFDVEVTGPSAANFTDTSTGDPTSWAWDFGDGGSSTLPNPAHDYGPGAPGMTYTVELTVTNAGGSSTAQKSVSFPAAPPPPMRPTANFDFVVSGPTAASFTDTSTGDPTSWAWDFGDGGSSTLPNPAHDYGPGAPGMTYTVELTVTNAGGSSTAQKSVSFPAAPPPPMRPTANFDFVVSGPTAASFSDTSTGGPTSWAWDFGDGEGSTLQNPAHDYGVGAPGTTYTVELTVTNAGGSSTAQKAVSFPP